MEPSKKVILAGASGFIGRALRSDLKAHGWSTTTLVRGESKQSDQIGWDPNRFRLDPATLAHADAVICLNGAPLARWPWSHSYKQTLVDSRLKSVKTIVDAINALPRAARPRALVSGSAVGYYGDCGDRILTEQEGPTGSFLSGLCSQWERQAQTADIDRVICIRTGLVLGDSGGLLPALSPLFRSYLGGRLGSGLQWMPTISLRDHIRATRFLLDSAHTGAFNLTGPEPVQNRVFTRALAEHVGTRPGPPVPARVLRAVLGDMAVIALDSQRAVPQRLVDAGFSFHDATIDQQLAAGGD
ncbi:MAG: TIGR01777 family oxidoreductase [Actinomycetaceae bacterium]|nr:TIGR01777 family oxidoreductase [Actinomycetaceae bacterium]